MTSRKEKISIFYKSLITLSAIVGILFQCEVGTKQFSLHSFKMFTTLSNLIVALFFIVYIYIHVKKFSLSSKGNQRLRYFKFLITMSILLTGLVAHFMLRGMFQNMDIMSKIGLFLLHYVVPIGTLFDWILFDEKGKTEWKMPIFATSFPILYVCITMFLAQFVSSSDRYPYPFLNVDMLGVQVVLLNIALLAIAFLLVGYLGVWLDHKI